MSSQLLPGQPPAAAAAAAVAGQVANAPECEERAEAALPANGASSDELRPVAPPTEPGQGAPRRRVVLASGVAQPGAGPPGAVVEPLVLEPDLSDPVTGRPRAQGQLGKLRAGLKLGVFKEAKGPSSPKPLPDGVDVSTPGIATAWLWFQELDGDKSGELDLAEIGQLLNRLGIGKNSKRAQKRAFSDMNHDGKGGVNFIDFAKWWNTQQAIARRDMRRVIKELFEGADTDRSGVLEKAEFAELVEQANKNIGLPALFSTDPTDTDAKAGFDLEEAWESIRKVPFAEVRAPSCTSQLSCLCCRRCPFREPFGVRVEHFRLSPTTGAGRPEDWLLIARLRAPSLPTLPAPAKGSTRLPPLRTV